MELLQVGVAITIQGAALLLTQQLNSILHFLFGHHYLIDFMPVSFLFHNALLSGYVLETKR